MKLRAKYGSFIGMKITRDIQTISELKQNASRIIQQVQDTGEPVILTVNGKPAAVLQDVESYQRMSGDADYWATVRVLRERIGNLEEPDSREKWLTHAEVFDRVRKKLKIKRR